MHVCKNDLPQLGAKTRAERWYRKCEKRCQQVFTARHILPQGNKARPAKPFSTCNILLVFALQVRNPFPNQFPPVSLIRVGAQSIDKYYANKVL